MSHYVTLEDVRAEGVLEATYDDDRVEAMIAFAERAFERATENWFYRKLCVVKVDGNDQEILHLANPICQGESQITSVTVNLGGSDPWTLTEDTDFVAYNDDGDRWNPKLAMTSYEDWASLIPETTYVPGHWPKGRRNITITGYFGFTDYELVEPEGEGDPVPTWTCPPEVKRAVLRLVVRDLALLTDVDGQVNRQSHRITSETTVGRSVTMGSLTDSLYSGGFTGDPDIDGAVAMFRRPMGGGVV